VLRTAGQRMERGTITVVATALGMRGRSIAAVVALAALLCATSAALASAAAPRWRVDSLSASTAPPGGFLSYKVVVTNVGDAPVDGSVPVTVTGTLPNGFTVADPSGPVSDPSSPYFAVTNGIPLNFSLLDEGLTDTVPCTEIDGTTPLQGGETSFRCTNPTPSSMLWEEVFMPVSVAPGATPGDVLTAHFTVEGGGAADPVTGADPTRISSTPPDFGIDGFDGEIDDAAGNPVTQAGAHPADATVSIDYNTLVNPVPLGGTDWPVAPTKDVFVDLPPGFVGAPASADTCTLAQLAHNETSFAPRSLCSPTSQVGTVLIRFQHLQGVTGPFPVFNMVAPPNAPAQFGFNVFGSIITLTGSLRSDGDYGLTVKAKDIPEPLGILGTTFTFWGVPSDPSHTFQRACSNAAVPSDGGPTCQSGAPRTAFLRNPTSCTDPGVGLPTTAHIDSWPNPGVFESATFLSHLAPGFPATPADWGPQVGTTGCDAVPFSPSFTASPPPPATPSTPAGFRFDLTLPQTSDPDLIGEGDLRSATVTLPAGVRVSPSSANGLGACSPADVKLHALDAPTCPDSSKIGSVTLTTPLLRDALHGAIYLAVPHDNPFGTLLSLYLVVEGQGVVVKLPGRVDPDPVTGQLTATFDDNPQLPFSNLHLEFNDGPRAPLVTPGECGTYTTDAMLTSWSGARVESTSAFTVSGDGHGGPCSPAHFTPRFNAGTDDPVAGASTGFRLSLARDDADQELKALTVNMPAGLLGKIADVPLCGASDAAGGSCPEGSRIGSVTVGAGAGPNPFFITNGRAYLTGSYKGAPFGLSIVVPAVAGPFDLGNVVVRSALFVDKHDASLRVVSDPLPTILQGIPLDVRDVRVSVDRSDFIVNPTSCAKKTVGGTIESTGGASAQVSSAFQVGECASLGFAPRMVLTVGGRGHTARGRTTPLTTRITMPKGDANLRFVRVTLPRAINARLTVIGDACTRTEFETNIAKCAHAQAGTATASTPLLRDPLRGKVYFVKNGHPLPDLFVALRGQVDFDLIGRITIVRSTFLRTTFEAAPDVPIRSFSLSLSGDSQNGSVGAAANLCSAKSKAQKATLDYIGQNGRALHVAPRLAVRGCPKHKAAHRRAAKRRR
jgi:uncharacterized repeat protein (TIGR01451 family)